LSAASGLDSGVKYVIIIPDGAGDLSLDELGGKTPLQAAHMPRTADLAHHSRIGAAVTTPPGWEAGSDVCSMCLLGYDPRRYHTGRAPLEAAALGLNPSTSDWIFRLNLVTVGSPAAADDGLMLDHSAGAITDAEARVLVEDLVTYWRSKEPQLCERLTLYPGVSYRNILIDSGGRDYAKVTCTPPHSIPRQPWAKSLPSGGDGSGAALLNRLMNLSRELLANHEVNLSRTEQGLRPANMAWIWGQGTRPAMPPFADVYGLRGAMITAVDLLAGIAAYIGWDRLPVPGLTSYHDNDYEGQGRAAVAAIDDYDIVCCHIEAPDESSHQGDWKTKVASLEAIDRHIVGPLVDKLRTFGDPEKDPAAQGWRLLMLPDHYTLVSTRKHDATPVPFLMAGSWVRTMVDRPFTEAAALASDLRIADGSDLMEYFLRSGRIGSQVR
jgi:2,3-bisphosphoglycerate-independent phosphoglycerate mutase